MSIKLANTQTSVGASLKQEVSTRASSSSFQSVVVGTFTGLTIVYEGSNDGVTWVTLGTSTAVAGDIIFITGKPVKFVRSNVTIFTGGTSVSVFYTPGDV